MKKILFFIAICLPIMLFAQEDSKYLEGAVPVKDGKVTFDIQMNMPSMSKELVYETALEWANKRFQPTEKFNARILYKDKEAGNIAVFGEEYIVFSSSSFFLDRTRIYYYLTIHCEAEKCDITMSRIRYWYNENRDGGEKYTAEEWITDEISMNKAKTKLYPITGKFRRKTIDLKDDLIKDFQNACGNKMIALGINKAPVTPESQVMVNVPQPVQGKVVITNQIPTEPLDETTLISQSTRMTITAGNDEQFQISKDCWGGFGELFGKKVAFCLIDTQKTMGNMLMIQSEKYKISFYSDNNNQPSVVIECKKLMTQSINGEEAQKMNPNCAVGKTYNMYVGEILK